MVFAVGMVCLGLLALLKISWPVAPAPESTIELGKPAPSQPTAPPPEPSTTPTTSPPTPQSAIAQGETLRDLARRYHTPVKAIMMANDITDPRILQVEQRLFIPDNDGESSAGKPARPMLVYEIQPDDTLLALAYAYGSSLDGILAANPGLEPTLLQIGQQIFIPSSKAARSPVIAGQVEVVHEVVAGDTPFALALKYGSSVEAILAANPGLEPRSLQIGQQLIIPPGSAARKIGASPRGATTRVISSSLASLEEAVLAMVNQERQSRKLAPYRLDKTLTRAARGHARDMIARGYFSHVTPDGKDLHDRLDEVGLEYDWVGENIQRNTQPADRTVQTAMGWFMGSAPHRRNILHRHYTRLGISVLEGPPGWYTFVLVFAE